jgi:DNA polymerase-1
VFGFFALVRKTHRELAPGSEIVVCFDSETATNPRRSHFPDYKAGKWYQRELTPFDWLPAIYEGLDRLSVQWCEAQSWEADDDIATLVGGINGRSAAIMSADRDFLQLVSRQVRLITPTRTYRVADVLERYSVHPTQWCDFRALTGDPSDNIPGVRGIGPKRAAYLLHRRRTLETARLPDNWWGRRLRDEYEQALQWRDLIRLQHDQRTGVECLGRPSPELPRAALVCELLDLWDAPRP